MRVRKKLSDGAYSYGTSTGFNTHSIGEVICYYDNGECESEFIDNLQVEIESGVWTNMSDAFNNKDIIVNNLNTGFDVPHSESEKRQGFNWY